MNESTDTKFKKIFNKAKSLASRYGFGHIAEDFAQDSCFKISQGRKTSLRNLFVDYQREQFGDTRFDRGFEKQLLTLRAISTSPIGEGEKDDWTESNLNFRDARTLPDQFRSIDDLLKGFASKDRAIILLRTEWGLNEVEIGNLFGVSESRVSQWLKGIQSRLSARITNATRDKTEGKEEMENILPSQTSVQSGLEQRAFDKMEIGQSWQMAIFNEASF